MKQEVPKTIDGQKFLFTQLSPRDALKVFNWVMGCIGKPLLKAVEAIDLKGDISLANALDNDVDFGKIGDALDPMFEKLGDDNVTEEKVDKLLSCVIHGGSTLNLDSVVFQGKTLLLMKVVKTSIEVNFADFLAARGGLKGMVAASKGTTQDQ